MTLHIRLSEAFGTFCADGEKAAAFRHSRIDPFLHSHEEIILDFQGVRSMNSSFANALIANLVRADAEALPKLRFANCNPRIRVLIESALELGVQRLRDRPANEKPVEA